MSIRSEQLAFPNGIDLTRQPIRNASEIEIDSPASPSSDYSAKFTIDNTGKTILAVEDRTGSSPVTKTNAEIFTKEAKIKRTSLANEALPGGANKLMATDVNGAYVLVDSPSAQASLPYSIPFNVASNASTPVYSDNSIHLSFTTIVGLIIHLSAGLDIGGSIKAVNNNPQQIASTALLAGTDRVSTLIRDNFVYALCIDNSNSAKLFRCSLSSDLSIVGNWVELTISGTALSNASNTTFLAGFGDGKFWVVNNGALVPYTLSGTTLTSGSTVALPIVTEPRSLRVNSNGIYAHISTSDIYTKADFTGNFDYTKQAKVRTDGFGDNTFMLDTAVYAIRNFTDAYEGVAVRLHI